VKKDGVGKGRRGIRIWCWCRGVVEGWAPPLQENLKWWYKGVKKMCGR